MDSAFNRVTFERLENGVVVSGRIGSAESWADAYRESLDPWQYDAVIASLLLDRIESILDCCEKPEDIAAQDEWLKTAWYMIYSTKPWIVNNKKLDMLKEYEAEIRSGKAFDDGDDE